MKEARTLLFIEIYFALRFLHILFAWDRNMREEAPMFEREHFNDRSNPFKKALGFHVLLYGSSIIALLVVLILNALFGWYSPFDTVVSICFFALVGHLPFLLGWMLTVERRRKQWLVITNYKSKLTQKERREAERKLKQTSLFKRLDRIERGSNSMNEKRILGLMNAPKDKRYRSFCVQAADSEEVWLMQGPSGAPALHGETVCVWPDKAFVQLYCAEAAPVMMEVHDFLDACRARIVDEDFTVCVFPNAEGGCDVRASRLIEAIQDELDCVE